jgi:hypothetical protein
MKRARIELLIAVLILTALSVALFFKPAKSWLDQSHESFLPKPLAEKLSTYRNYPIFWWNFLIIENGAGTEVDPAKIAAFCRELSVKHTDEIGFLPCSADLKQLKPYLEDWVKDWPRRSLSPSQAETASKTDQALAKLSLPMDRELMQIVRLDPMETYKALQTLEGQSVKFQFAKYSGFYYDKKTGRALLPIQFAYPPNEADKTQAILEDGKILNPTLIGLGPHVSSFENEHQVKEDVQNVSLAGGVLLVLISVFMIFMKQWRLLIFYPFLALSTLASITLTVLWFGKIHGLVLAFGPGIIGLSMDYAVHASFSAAERDETWLANAVGLLTTITVVLVGYFSKLPVIQQLMFFSGSGLFIGFLIFFLLNRSEPSLFQARAFFKRPLRSRPLAGLVGLTAVLAIAGFLFAKPSLKLSDIGFESPALKSATRWLVQEGKMSAPFVTVSTEKPGEPFTPLEQTALDRVWAKKNGIDVKTISELLPPPMDQARNLASWTKDFCSWQSRTFSETKELFQPFLDAVSCGSLSPRDISAEPPRYLKDFRSFEGDSWITLWFPSTEKEIALVKSAYPTASSLVELATLFPRALTKEGYWMAPIIFLLSTVLLFLYYKRSKLVALALLPFLTGLGTYFAAYWVFGLTISFVSFISFIMIFGFSLDYGIFAVNVEDAESSHADEVRSALTLTTAMTLAGFVPLLFAHHPAMKHLGEGLVTGTIGTYFGAVSLVPFLRERLKRA